MAILHHARLFCKRKTAKEIPESLSKPPKAEPNSPTLPTPSTVPPCMKECQAALSNEAQPYVEDKIMVEYASSETKLNLQNSRSGELKLDESAVVAPCEYIRSLHSKDIRKKLIDSFNIWFQLPINLTTTISEIINDLHNASLILDDIQDGSLLRRGSPATHCIFGNAQSVNSATYMFMNTCLRIQSLQLLKPTAMDTLLKGTMGLFVGQSWELKWKFHVRCPSVREYMAMIDGKTGAMFTMLVHLMHSMSNSSVSLVEFDRFTILLGRFYQVRDDYINLQDDKYSEQKGFCEDLDEGKFSFPVISCCNSDPIAGDILLGIFRQSQGGTTVSRNMKTYMLDLIKKSGAFEATWELLQELKNEMCEALAELEAAAGKPNPALWRMMEMLAAIQQPK